MLAKVLSATTIGLDGVIIEVEVDVANRGFPTFTIVGLPNKAVDEAKDRVRTAIINSGFEMPDSRITVNLAPADIPKIGSCFDLPIAIGILAACGVIPVKSLINTIFLGELSLQGTVRRVPGIISVALLTQEHTINALFIPADNIVETSIVENLNVFGVKTLFQLVQHLSGKTFIEKVVQPLQGTIGKQIEYEYNFADIKGQEYAKRALEIAAAGFHNIHLRGSPGAGKTMLSRAFTSILPPLDQAEVLEVSKIYSITGLLEKDSLFNRPFRSPHHTISRIGLIGGGSHPAPGEISLAHRGVLFLDEFTEFPQAVMEAMRQPLEDGFVTISRASGRVTFPCRFLLLAASNPCPCGYLGHPKKKCTCHPLHALKYAKKISGPMLDRIDLHLDVLPIEEEKLLSYKNGESSTFIKERVLLAQEIQKKRFINSKIRFNSEMSSKDIKLFCNLTSSAEELLKKAISQLSLSARGYTRLIKIAQTIADLAYEDSITVNSLAEALQYRVKEV